MTVAPITQELLRTLEAMNQIAQELAECERSVKAASVDEKASLQKALKTAASKQTRFEKRTLKRLLSFQPNTLTEAYSTIGSAADRFIQLTTREHDKKLVVLNGEAWSKITCVNEKKDDEHEDDDEYEGEGGGEDEEDVSYEDKRSKVKAVSKSAAK